VTPDAWSMSNMFGSWHLANEQMLNALEFANRSADFRKLDGPRYDFDHAWGDGWHSDDHGGQLLPDILRWMFRDYPKDK